MSDKPETKECLECLRPNPSDALTCAFCGGGSWPVVVHDERAVLVPTPPPSEPLPPVLDPALALPPPGFLPELPDPLKNVASFDGTLVHPEAPESLPEDHIPAPEVPVHEGEEIPVMPEPPTAPETPLAKASEPPKKGR